MTHTTHGQHRHFLPPGTFFFNIEKATETRFPWIWRHYTYRPKSPFASGNRIGIVRCANVSLSDQTRNKVGSDDAPLRMGGKEDGIGPTGVVDVARTGQVGFVKTTGQQRHQDRETYRSTLLSMVPSPSRGMIVRRISVTPRFARKDLTAVPIMVANLVLVPVGSPMSLRSAS